MKNFFKKRYFLPLLVLAIFVIILNNNFLKFKISRLILSHELSIMPNLIVKKISRISNFDLFKDKKQATLVLNDYVATHVRPIEINLDDGASWKMLHGSIWCDGVSDILNRLLEVIEVRSYLVWLHDNNMNTPHAVSMVDFLDQKLINGKNSSLDQKTLYLFDPQNNYLPLNNNKEVVNIKYMIENSSEFVEMKKLHSDGVTLNLLINNAQLWDRNIFGKENSAIRNFSKIFVKYSPDFLITNLIKFSIYINPKIDENTKKFYFARVDHILLNYDSAWKKYNDLAKKNIYAEESFFWVNSLK